MSATMPAVPSKTKVVKHIVSIVTEGDVQMLTPRIVRTQLESEFPNLPTGDDQWRQWFANTLRDVVMAESARRPPAAPSSPVKRKRTNTAAKKSKKKSSSKKSTAAKPRKRSKPENSPETSTHSTTANRRDAGSPAPTALPRYGATDSDSDFDSGSEAHSGSELDGEFSISQASSPKKPKRSAARARKAPPKRRSIATSSSSASSATSASASASPSSKMTLAQQFELAAQNPWLAATTTRRAASTRQRRTRAVKTAEQNTSKRTKAKANATEVGESTPGDAASSTADATGTQKKQQKKKATTGWAKPLVLSPRLSEFFGGVEQMSRLEIGKRLRAYVKERSLQSPKDGRKILFDDRLQVVFKRKTCTYFKLGALISQHAKDPKDMI
jgi:chromatin remodeling complex protein RSC6